MIPLPILATEDRFCEPKRKTKNYWFYPVSCIFELVVGVVVSIRFGICFGLISILFLYALVILSALFIDTLMSSNARQLLVAESGISRVEDLYIYTDRIFGLSSRGTELIYWQRGQPPRLFRPSEIKKILVSRMWYHEVEDIRNVEWETRRHPINDLDEKYYSINYSVYSFEHSELGEIARLYVDYEFGDEKIYNFLLTHFDENQFCEVDEFPS